MQIYVCIKHVPDSAANITIVNNNGIDQSIAFLLNPYDEHAVTQAAVLKKEIPDSNVIAVCLGKKDAEKTIRSALAMGADRGILICTDSVGSNTTLDSMITARALKAAMDRDKNPDIILMGKESIDAEGMQTMFRLGALFDFPVASNAVSIKIGQARAIVEYGLSGNNTKTCDMALPCVIAAGRGLNTPSYPTFPDVVKARKKPVRFIDFQDLSIDLPLGDLPLGDLPLGDPTSGTKIPGDKIPAGTRIIGLEPLVQKRSPKEITGTPREIAEKLADILKNEAKVIS